MSFFDVISDFAESFTGEVIDSLQSITDSINGIVTFFQNVIDFFVSLIDIFPSPFSALINVFITVMFALFLWKLVKGVG